MSKKRRAAERYHDRVAPRYDAIYGRDAYWEFYRAVTWEHLRRFIPSDLGAPVLDVGCGTGEWGLRLARSGYRVVLSDLSLGMLEGARRRAEELGVSDRVEFVQADICDLSALGDATYSLAIAEGDPLSFCDDPRRALRELNRVLRAGGHLVASVDHVAGAIEHFLKVPGGCEDLENFLRTGRTQWLARSAEDRFPVKMFSSDELTSLVNEAGFSTRSLIGKTVIPLRYFPESLGDSSTIREWVRLETRLSSRRDFWGRASHLEIAARKEEPEAAQEPRAEG